MKSIFTLAVAFALIFAYSAQAQRTLDVSTVEQEQDQWCWAATSKCLMDYFGKHYKQCEIADYARTVITWRDFGPANCCEDATQGCNWWNYMFPSELIPAEGTLYDILNHMGGIVTTPYSDNLTLKETKASIDEERPFIFRWGWTGGGGHFLVMYGYDGDYVAYMNPWFGEGKKLSLHSWVDSSADHKWTHTLPVIQLNPATEIASPDIRIFPNPTDGELNIAPSPLLDEFDRAEIINQLGNTVFDCTLRKGADFKANISELSVGVYFLKLSGKSEQRVLSFTKVN